MEIKANKEFVIRNSWKETHKILITAVKKNTDGTIKTITYQNLDFFELEETVLLEEFLSFGDFEKCITASEFFTMYCNYTNSLRKRSIFYDLEFAKKLKQDIKNALRLRKTVSVGDGKFEEFDKNNLQKFLNNNHQLVS